MNRKIFVNLAVRDFSKSKAFFEALGFGFDPQFTDDTAGCLVISDTIYAMLITLPKFQGFLADKAICDSHTTTEVILALTCESREQVDTMVRQAIKAGGKLHGPPQDHGFMYLQGFEDLDGHIWEPFHLVPNAVPPSTSPS